MIKTYIKHNFVSRGSPVQDHRGSPCQDHPHRIALLRTTLHNAFLSFLFIISSVSSAKMAKKTGSRKLRRRAERFWSILETSSSDDDDVSHMDGCNNLEKY
jgi:hypothetical protein